MSEERIARATVQPLPASGCCDGSSKVTPAGICPNSGTEGQTVTWRTVAALVRGPLPRRQSFWLCREPHCPVAYFGDGGAVVEAHELHVEPGFKNPVDGLLCYCFGHRRSDFAWEIRGSGSATLTEIVREKTRAGDCACEVRNPSGRCCLGEVDSFVRSLRKPHHPPRGG